jgi:hypothetical protein
MANNPLRESTSLLATKVGVVGTTLFIAGGMATTSMQFIPALITAAQRIPSTTPSDPKSGRLTPQPTESKQLSIDANNTGAKAGGSYDGYRAAAQQFTSISKMAFATQVPPELISILASSYLAYHSFTRNVTSAGYKWTAVAVLVASIFPLTGGFMVPLDKKIARLGGDLPKLETFEDAPPDREAERRNTVEFLGKWNGLNQLRSVVMFAAGGIGLWGLVD